MVWRGITLDLPLMNFPNAQYVTLLKFSLHIKARDLFANSYLVVALYSLSLNQKDYSEANPKYLVFLLACNQTTIIALRLPRGCC
jgi:hypothetical protein